MRPRTASILCVCFLSFVAAAGPAQATDPPAWTFWHDGAAGDWLVLNVPLAHEVDAFAWQQHHKVTATAPPDHDGHLLVVPLDVRSHAEGFPAWPYDPPAHHTIPAGETVTFDSTGHWSASISGGLWRSLAVAVASDVPYTFELTIDPDEGYPALGAPQRNSGTGTTVQTGDELLATPVAPADAIHLEGTFATPGWHHVQLEFDYVQPDGVRSYEVRFPTASWDGLARMTGYHAVLTGSAASSGMIDVMGSYTDTAGDFSIDLTYAQASWDVDVVLYEMPGAFTLPPDWAATYATNRWPTWDCFTCPPLPDA